MKLLTFLGTGKYEEVEYVWQDKPPVRTCYFASALAQWLQPDEVLVCLTNEAKGHPNWKGLQGSLNGFSIIPVGIPSGKVESELWDIFDAIVAHLHENSEVIIDITHAFRSIPLLAFVASTYLSQAKNVQILNIVYGAFEAKDGQGRVPVFDLTPFLVLQDWINAAHQFVKTGDSRDLAALLREAQALRWKSAKGSPDPQTLPQQLNTLGDTLIELSRALMLARVQEVGHFARLLPQHLQNAASEAVLWAKPFTVLQEQVQQEYAEFIQSDPAESLYTTASLTRQSAQIKWYLENRHIMQALALAREWLVSWVCAVEKNENREEVEQALNQARLLGANRPLKDKKLVLTDRLLQRQDAKLLIKAWDNVVTLRNDVAHCGIKWFRQKTLQERIEFTRKIETDAHSLVAQLITLKGAAQ